MPTGFKKALKKPFTAQKKRLDSFLSRRPHRSFRMTRRRDYVRPLELPGNISFTAEVTKTVWKYKKIFSLLVVVYVVLYAVLVGLQSQESYASFSDTITELGGDMFEGALGAVGQASLLFVSSISAGVNSEATEAQQIFSVFIFLLTWLTTVWLLRNLLAGHKVKLRDGLYNSGSPFLSTLLITFLIGVQLVPVALAVIGYSAALSSGLLAGGAASMLFWIGAALLCVLSLYWITSTLFALVIVTLPGMYPYQAIKTAGDIMVGRRVKILLRWVWMMLAVVVSGLVVMIPIVLLDMWLKSIWPVISGVPIVPAATIVFVACAVVWMATYVYLLYRKVVDYVPAK